MTHRAVLLGIDIGTTGVRAAAITELGTVVAHVSEPCPPDTRTAGRAEADAQAWWDAVCRVVSTLGERVALADVVGIGVTGQTPTAVLVDDAGRPVRPAILWLDVRAGAEARAIDHDLGPGGAGAIGGNAMHAYYLGPKLAWLKAHEPQSLEAAALVLQSHAFIVLRLTGEAVCDPSAAMLCAPLFDARSRAWSADGARAVGVDMTILPKVTRAHDVVGHVTRQASQATGLREGTPVVAGGGDFAAAALGAGVTEKGQACVMLGTAGNLLVPMTEPRFDTRLINSHHVGVDRWLAIGGTLCGGALEWFRQACAPGASWEQLEAEARAALESQARADRAAATDLIVLPYFQGERTPIWDERARAVIFGADLTHARGHLYLALLEGIALGFKDCLRVVEEGGLRLKEVVATSGAGQSGVLRQLLSDALGAELTWRAGSEGTVTGAAILAGIGVGCMPSLDSAGAASGLMRHRPDPPAQERLERLFARRRALYEAIKGQF
jgi:xylulokinase